MDFQIIIDSVVINDEPKELNIWADEAAYDRELYTVLLDFPSSLTFVGDGYEFLLLKKSQLGYIGELPVVINIRDNASSAWRPLHTGIIFLSSLSSNTDGEVVCRITDDSFNARIRTNKDIKGYVSTSLSKNGVGITAVLNLRLDLFAASTGTYTSNYAAYDLLRCLQWMAQFLSDGTMTVVSDYYDSLDTTVDNTELLKKIAIITGEEIKQIDSGFSPHVSWTMLTEFIVNTFNLKIGVERNSDGATQIRFEPEEYFEGSAIVEIQNIPFITTSTNQQLLYSTIECGSVYYVKDENLDDGYPLPLIPSYTNGREQYYIKGTGNTGGELDLTTEISTDTNAIYELLELGIQDHFDDVVFAIEYWNNSGDFQAMKTQYFNSSYLYNQHLTTGEILNRHRFFGDVISQYGDDDDKFAAILTDTTFSPISLSSVTGSFSIEPFRFDNDYAGYDVSGFSSFPVAVADPSNNWGNGTTPGNPVLAANSRYTIPAPGYYEFFAMVIFRVLRQQIAGMELEMNMGIRRYDSSNTLIEDREISTQIISFETLSALAGSATDFEIFEGIADIFCIAGDYIQVYVEGTYSHFPPLFTPPYNTISFVPQIAVAGGSNLEVANFWTIVQCILTNNGGGTVVAGNYLNYPAELDEFEVPIDQETWELIKNNLSLGINYSGEGTTKRLGFIESIEHTTWDQTARFKLRRKPNNT